uniref:Uncharacterized protein n=1 Tax=Ditylenchus dipsaci TaxID=166011 RepID=A0A915DN16_9BILA
MPKSNKSQAALLKEWASKFPDGIYTVDQKLLYCQAFKIAQTIFNSSEVVQKLAYIQSNFSFIPTAIKKLETQGLSLNQSYETLDAVKTIVEAAPGEICQRVKEKFNSVMQNNSALNRLLAISKVQRGAIADLNMPPNQIASVKNATMQFGSLCPCSLSLAVYLLDFFVLSPQPLLYKYINYTSS